MHEFKETTALKKILKLKKRLKVIQGGSSAGKTIAILLILIDIAQTSKNELISVVSETFPHLKRGALRDFLNIMEGHGYFKEDNWNRTDCIYTFETGSRIEFFSADSADKVRGPRRDILFVNECNNISYETYTQLAIRTNGDIYLDYNPVSEFWVNTELMPNNECDFIIITYKDNEALPEAIIKEIESRKNRKGWFDVYGLGILGEVEGKIYKNWNIVDEIPHEARLERYGIDFGYSNDPTAIVAVYYYNGGYIIDEIIYQKEMLNKQIADTLLNLKKCLVVADSAEPKSIADIKQYGLNIVGAKKRAERFGTRDTYNKWAIGIVQEQQISITKQSVNLIKEYRNYLWQVDKDGRVLNEPEKGQDHCLVGDTKILMANGKQKKLKNVKVGEVVKTQHGINKVLLSRLTRKDSDIWELTLSNGQKLRGTGDHKIYTDRGKIPLDSLRYDDIIEVINNKKLLLWKKQSYSIIKDIIGMVNTITEFTVPVDYIRQFGYSTMEKYQKDFISTTKTKIEQTMKSLILNLKKLRNIYQNTLRIIGKDKNLEKELENIAKMLDRLQKNGTLLRRELSGIDNTEKNVGKTERCLRRYANSVEKNIKLVIKEKVIFATKIVELRRCEEKENVYNLTVENEHNYYANGILVKNCLDACKYAIISLAPTIMRQSILDSRPIFETKVKPNPAR